MTLRIASLPMASSPCGLSEHELRTQLDRYARVGAAGRLRKRDDRRVVIEIAPAVPDELVDQLVATERACCPFFLIEWDSTTRVLSIGVADADGALALDLIAQALTSALRIR